MSRLTPNIKVRNPFFIPPMGRLDDGILNSLVTIQNNKGEAINLKVSEYIQNQRGLNTGAASDGQHYSEVIGNIGEDSIFRSLATKYIPASSSSSPVQPPFYVSTDSNKTNFNFVSFEDKTSTMTEQDIIQAINTAVGGYTVKGKLRSISSLHCNRILVLEDGSEFIIKTTNYVNYVKMETSDGVNTNKFFNAKFLWEMVDRTVPDSDIVTFLADNYNLGCKIDELDVRLDDAIHQTMVISNNISSSIDSLRYELDSTKNTVIFLANKIAEQKAQISALQSSVSSSTSMLYNIIDHIDKEQGSNYIKLEDLSRSVQGVNTSLAEITVLPSKIEELNSSMTKLIVLPSKIDDSLVNDKEILGAVDSVRIMLASQSDEKQDTAISRSDKILTSITSVNLLLQIINLITRKGDKNE